MSEEMKPRYEQDPLQCPFCFAEDLVSGIRRKRGYRELYEEKKCQDCGKDFDAIYVFSHFNPAE